MILRDIVTIGAFTVTTHRILIPTLVKNGRPNPGCLTNATPWIITMGAGTLDRDFSTATAWMTTILLGIEKDIRGFDVTVYKLPTILSMDMSDASCITNSYS